MEDRVVGTYRRSRYRMREGIRHRSGHVGYRDASCLPVIDGVDPSPENSRRRKSRRRFRETRGPPRVRSRLESFLLYTTKIKFQPASTVNDDRQANSAPRLSATTSPLRHRLREKYRFIRAGHWRTQSVSITLWYKPMSILDCSSILAEEAGRSSANSPPPAREGGALEASKIRVFALFPLAIGTQNCTGRG